MIRPLVFALALSAVSSTVAAQRPPASDVADLLVFGGDPVREGRLKGLEPELQSAIDAHIQRGSRYKTKLVAPRQLASLDGMVYEARVAYERLLAAETADPRGPALAAEYVLALRPCYEWEGYHDCPEREALFADRYQATHPTGPFSEFLPLLGAHRWLCAAEGYDYENKPDEGRRARAAYERDIAVAKGSKSLLIRVGADGLSARATCMSRYPEGHIYAHVTDSTGGVMPGVTIVASPRTGASLKCVTDARGACGLLQIVPQHYRLEAMLSGFATQAGEVDLIDGQFYRWEVKMTVAPRRGFEDLVAQVTKFGGSNLIDCGRFRPTLRETVDRLGSAMKCAEDAVSRRAPFWIANQHQGIDSLIADGLVGTSEGVVYRFDYDSDPCGGSGCPSRFTTQRCDHPALAARDGLVRFACSDREGDRHDERVHDDAGDDAAPKILRRHLAVAAPQRVHAQRNPHQ
jgi:hypothetical protein